MFELTKAAVKQVRQNLENGDLDDMPLRIAAQRADDGSIHYQMGFDEAGPGDLMVSCRGVDVVIADEHKSLLQGARLDYVTLDDGEENFIFLNPNDPNYVAPDEQTSAPDEEKGHSKDAD